LGSPEHQARRPRASGQAPLEASAQGRCAPGCQDLLRRNVKASPLGSPLGFIEWDKTRAFYASVSGRSVYVNLKGRQPHGIVEPGREYEELRAELKERLLGLKDPATGNHVAQAVHTREEVYSGPFVNQAPTWSSRRTAATPTSWTGPSGFSSPAAVRRGQVGLPPHPRVSAPARALFQAAESRMLNCKM